MLKTLFWFGFAPGSSHLQKDLDCNLFAMAEGNFIIQLDLGAGVAIQKLAHLRKRHERSGIDSPQSTKTAQSLKHWIGAI